MKRVSREQWQREDRETNYITAGLMVLLAGVVVCGVLSAFLLLLSILSITL